MSVEDGNVGVSLDLLQNPIALDMTTDGGFAAALNEVRRLKRGGVCIVGLCCKSFSGMPLVLRAILGVMCGCYCHMMHDHFFCKGPAPHQDEPSSSPRATVGTNLCQMAICYWRELYCSYLWCQ